jgi:hypothetical protein
MHAATALVHSTVETTLRYNRQYWYNTVVPYTLFRALKLGQFSLYTELGIPSYTALSKARYTTLDMIVLDNIV